jgi:hypothetical protein
MRLMPRLSLGVLAISIMLAGCSPLPLEPKYNRDTLKASGVTYAAVSHADAKAIAAAWHKELGDAAQDRRKQEIAASELLFYGTLLFSGAQLQLAKEFSKGMQLARNIGVGTAAGVQLLSGHYQPKDQRAAFRRGEDRMKCLNDSLSVIPSTWDFDPEAVKGADADLAKGDKPTTLQSLYLAVPRQAMDYIEGFVTPSLQAELLEIKLSTPSKEDLISTVKRYSDDSAKGAGAAASASSEVQKTPLPAPLASGNKNVLSAAEQKKKDEEDKKAAEEAAKARQLKILADAAAIEAITSFSAGLAVCRTK